MFRLYDKYWGRFRTGTETVERYPKLGYPPLGGQWEVVFLSNTAASQVEQKIDKRMTQKTITLRNLVAFAGLTVGLMMFETPAMAVNVVNGNFSTFTGSGANGGANNGSGLVYQLSGFSTNGSNAVTSTTYIGGWNIATADGNNALGFVYAPGTFATALADTFGTTGFTIGDASVINAAPSPDGGNVYVADGDPGYNLAIYQTLTSLTVGATYVVSFQQAAGQQAGFTGSTTEYWQVGFNAGTVVPATTLQTVGATYKNSTVMTTPQQGFTAWNTQSISFVATSATETLSFLSEGTPGNAPPMVFLDGVTVTQTPEPATLGLGLLGFGALIAARRARKSRA
jgi:hypothetical protein